jgi:anti-anti-sigma factor
MGPMMGELDVVMTGGPRRVALTLAGDFDLESASTFEAAARDALHRPTTMLSVDLRDVAFMDSTGLRTLITVHDWARSAGLRLEIVRPPAHVQRVFDLTGMTPRLPLVDSPAA